MEGLLWDWFSSIVFITERKEGVREVVSEC